MKRDTIRRIAALLIGGSLFLPWLNLYFTELSGFEVAIHSISESETLGFVSEMAGYSNIEVFAVIFGVVMIGIAALALWVLIAPDKVAMISLLVTSGIIIVLFFAFFDVRYNGRLWGSNITIIGLIVGLISLFLPAYISSGQQATQGAQTRQAQQSASTNKLNETPNQRPVQNPVRTQKAQKVNQVNPAKRNQQSREQNKVKPLPQKFCIYCGMKLFKSAKFCTGCGKPIKTNFQ